MRAVGGGAARENEVRKGNYEAIVLVKLTMDKAGLGVFKGDRRKTVEPVAQTPH